MRWIVELVLFGSPCVGLLSVGGRREALDGGELEFWGFGVLVLFCFESLGLGWVGLFPGGLRAFEIWGDGTLVIADRKTCKYFQICVIGYGLMTAQK